MTTRIAIFQTSEVFPFVGEEKDPKVKNKHQFQVGDRTYSVKMSSQRLILFKSNPKCVCCGVEGSFFALEQHTNETPHLNFYAIKDGKEMLMTKDHIVPIAKSGKDYLSNYQTMCAECNELKSSHTIVFDKPAVHVPPKNADDFPETIEWPGHGTAKRVMPRGMSDYPRLDNNRIYSTTDGFTLYIHREYTIAGESYQRKLSCKTQSKNFTSPSLPTIEEAMAWLEKQINHVPSVPDEVEWPGLGAAKIRGKTDKGYTLFKTSCGFGTLMMNRCAVTDEYPEGLRWVANFQGLSTKWCPSAKDAIFKAIEKATIKEHNQDDCNSSQMH
jgi:5-methylcytosine-specific restriction endonuclease McrA